MGEQLSTGAVARHVVFGGSAGGVGTTLAVAGAVYAAERAGLLDEVRGIGPTGVGDAGLDAVQRCDGSRLFDRVDQWPLTSGGSGGASGYCLVDATRLWFYSLATRVADRDPRVCDQFRDGGADVCFVAVAERELEIGLNYLRWLRKGLPNARLAFVYSERERLDQRRDLERFGPDSLDRFRTGREGGEAGPSYREVIDSCLAEIGATEIVMPHLAVNSEVKNAVWDRSVSGSLAVTEDELGGVIGNKFAARRGIDALRRRAAGLEVTGRAILEAAQWSLP